MATLYAIGTYRSQLLRKPKYVEQRARAAHGNMKVRAIDTRDTFWKPPARDPRSFFFNDAPVAETLGSSVRSAPLLLLPSGAAATLGRMTPSLRTVYEELLALASTPRWQSRAHELRRAFADRTGGEVDADQAFDEPRHWACWDHALCSGLSQELAPEVADRDLRALAQVFGRSQRGIFRMELVDGRTLVHDLVGGAVFHLVKGDDVGQSVSMAGESSFFDGRVVAAADGAALLAGVIFHPMEASTAIEDIVGGANGMAAETICDALLRMRHSFFTMTRVKVSSVYRKLEAPRRSDIDSPTRSSTSGGSSGTPGASSGPLGPVG